jgi:DNA replication protein DnaC
VGIRPATLGPSRVDTLTDEMLAAAMLDRLLERSVVMHLDGDSYRLRSHHARADTLRTATRQHP